ncbi:MAG: hypothetical protein WCO55_04630 [Candidatus Falkowbacteria bacterium]
MKKSTISLGILAITILATAAVGTTVWAAGGRGMMNKQFKDARPQQTAAQITDQQAKQKAVQDALASGNYDAYVAAFKALNEGRVMTSEQFKAKSAEHQARLEKNDAVNAALVAGDYTAWVKAETAANPNSPMLTKVTATNFASYKQAMDLRKQSDDLMKSLGIVGPGNEGAGRGGAGCMMGGRR